VYFPTVGSNLVVSGISNLAEEIEDVFPEIEGAVTTLPEEIEDVFSAISEKSIHGLLLFLEESTTIMICFVDKPSAA